MRRKHATLLVVIAVVVGGLPTTLGAVGADGGATLTDVGDRAGVAGSSAAPGASAAAAAQAQQNATLTFENQTSNGTAVTVAEVNLSDGGFVAIHDLRLVEAAAISDSVIGVSEYLEPGTTENVTVELNETLDESQQLIAVAYQDTNDNQTYDFVESNGQVDGTYLAEDQIVADDAQVTVDQDVATPTPNETTTTETTETPNETITTTPNVTETPPATETTVETPNETTTTETITTETTTTETTTETPTTTETTETTTTTETTETPTTTETTTTTETPTTTETTETTTTTTETPTTTETTETTTAETPTETTTTETTTTETTTAETTTETTETTTETTPADPEPPVDQRQISFSIDSVHVADFSFVLGHGEVDRTVTVEDESVADRTIELDVTEALYGASPGEQVDATDEDSVDAPEGETVRVVFRNVSVQNVEFVVTLPEDVPMRFDGEPPEDVTTTETTTTETPTTTETTTEETTAPTETTEETTTTPDETTTTEETITEETTTTETITETTPTETETDDAVESLQVSEFSAPSTIVLDEGQMVVDARLENPGDSAVTEQVQLRVGGTVVAEQEVEVGPGETESVQFQVDRAELDVEPDETFVEVLTRDYGQVDLVTIQETGAPDDETTTESATDTTEEAGDDTTEADDETETTVVDDTTTTEADETTEIDDEPTDVDDDTTTEDDDDVTTTEVDDTTAEDDEPTETDPAGDASLEVSGLDAPDSIVLDGETLVVGADLRNPTDEAVTETVQLRVNGTVVAEQEVEVEPGESRQVEFEAEKADLDLAPGEAFLEVLTREFGESITVTVESESSD